MLVVYLILGYLAVPHTIWAGKVIIYSDGGQVFIQRLIYAMIFGWILIPWWFLVIILGRKK